MAQSIPTLFKDGQAYMQTWPMKKELYGLFPECRVIAATRFSIRYMPAMAILVAFAHVMTLGHGALPQALALAAFFISLPMQGLLWLGHRSNQQLPPAMAHWYREIHQKMRQQGCNLQQAKARPRYKELAHLLGTAFKELDKVFTRQWF
ncbi:terminus macrodomain insulation protein YfbV [Lacimicrobium sp. SS2-24]|uniref:terminus macrodomain insulation protein YfbV n=1 Tax=Lacimicrobium sp. SS2-24 TaxID=2005569 RepID=UPI000B4A80DB|nr:terminus macrodomain insulation protein YfbV [Lacimicrobium sp. SS2-24]